MKSNIEIAPKKYWINCTYAEAVLYCFQLEINGIKGWRLPTKKENNDAEIDGWYQNDKYTGKDIRCAPVRDIL